ncbi:MAG: hypothetical protein L3J35_05425 [Bacteroidales bacterium]|nr:hypothetical protein [Bacteroidales bacterium]
MRTILIFTVGLFLCSAYSIPKYDMKKSMDNYEEFKSLEIPLYFDAGIYPFIYVNIQGNKIPVHVDIGDETGNFSFDEKSLESIKYKSVSESNYSTGFNGIIKNNDYFNINEIDIEGIKFRNIVCKKDNTKLPNYLMDIGNVGLNFLKEFNFKIDYKNKLLTLYKKGFIPDDITNYWTKIILNKKPLLTFNGRIQGYNKILQVGIDTGTIMIGKDIVENLIRIPLKHSFISKQKVDYINDELKLKVIRELSITNENSLIDSLDFLIYKTKQPKDRDIFLGGDFFFKYNTFFDNKNNILYISKNKT